MNLSTMKTYKHILYKLNKMFKTIAYLILVFVMIGIKTSSSQNDINQVLKDVSANNPAIKAYNQYLEAEIAGYKTSLYPENPQIEYGYFPGNVSDIGTKETFGIKQTFNFPTVYFNKQKLTELQISQTEYKKQLYIQNILLQAKLCYYEIIYLNKLKKEYEKRIPIVETFFNGYNKKLEEGDATIMDVNRAKLLLLNFENQQRAVNSQILQYSEKLKQLNGGTQINISDTTYSESVLLSIETIINKNEELNPELRIYSYDKDIALSEVKLSKSLYLPGFEVGYGSEKVLDDKFSGVQFGMSIPLWGKINTINRSKQRVTFSQFQEENLRSESELLIREQYLNVLSLEANYNEYKQSLNSIKGITLLNKALELGEISTLEYSLEITFYYEIYDNYLLIEKEYYKGLAELFKFEL